MGREGWGIRSRKESARGSQSVCRVASSGREPWKDVWILEAAKLLRLRQEIDRVCCLLWEKFRIGIGRGPDLDEACHRPRDEEERVCRR